MDRKVQNKIDLVVRKLTSLEEIDGSEYTGLSREERERIGYFSRDFGMKHWDWPQGVGLYGLSLMGEEYHTFIKAWADEEISKGLPIPNINTIRPLFTLMDFQEYEDLCLRWAEKIMEDFDRTDERGLQHNTTGETKDTLSPKHQQIWADTVFMTVLFLGKMGKKYGKKEWMQEATYQVLLHLKYLLDRESGLYYHGWDFARKSNYGGIFWCRGNSWLTMGLPLFIDIMGNELPLSVQDYLTVIYKNQLDELLRLRDEKEKLWHTVLDDETSYIEVSGSSGIVAGIYMGLNAGLLPDDKYRMVCEESVEKLLEQIDAEGTVHGVSAGTVIADTKEHYRNIIIKPMAYGQAMMLCALVQSQNYHREEQQVISGV